MIERDIHVKLMASVFVDAHSLRKDATFRDKLGESLKEQSIFLVPVSLEARFGLPDELAADIPIAVFQSETGDRQIQISTRRFDYVMGVPAPSSNMPAWDEFLTDAIAGLAAVLDATGRSAYRLAFIAEDIATDMVERKSSVREVATRMINLPEGIGADELTEWQWRAPFRRDVDGTVYNLLPRVTGVTGTQMDIDFDGLRFEIDVNTWQGQTQPRFGTADLRAEFMTLKELAENLLESVCELVGEF